jgi:16S rRNA (cytosine1402-N4)-methyltransferase
MPSTSAYHAPVLASEVIELLRTSREVLDCTLGGGGHARAILERLQPGGRLIALDVDPVELPRTEAVLRGAGFAPDTFTVHPANFAGLPKVLAAEGVAAADVIVADLGVSSMQLDNPDRGFSYKDPGPLDMRMNPSRGEPASQLLARLGEEDLASLLQDNADEPYAWTIARLLKQKPVDTTHALESLLRLGLASVVPDLTKADLKLSVRRTFQALRVAVNDELAVLDSLLRLLPFCLAPGGRVAILTFHSGEDRRVKKAFQAGHRAGIYSAVATEVIRSTTGELRANRRAQAAKLRWAVRTDC